MKILAENILIIDDDALIRGHLVELLSQNGCYCTALEKADDILDLLAQSDFALTLLDINLPGSSGEDLLRLIRTKYSELELPVIMVSSHHDAQSIAKFLNIGANDYITKPIDKDITLARIATQLHLKSIKETVERQNLKGLESAKMLALGRMAEGAAHEINNPLTIVRGGLEILKQRLAEIEKLSEDDGVSIDKMILGTDRILSVINSLQAFSTRTVKLGSHSLRVKELIESTLDLCRQAIASEHIALQVSIPEENPAISGERSDYIQALFHLINNARDAVKKTKLKSIKIEVFNKVDDIEIRVTDNGEGIDKDIRERIFEPFYSTKKVGEGTGLGLSAAYGLVHTHGGSIELDTNTTKSTCFIMRLPKRNARQLAS